MFCGFSGSTRRPDASRQNASHHVKRRSVSASNPLPSAPPNWTALGTLTNDGSGQYQFNDLSVKNGGQRFYRVRSP